MKGIIVADDLTGANASGALVKKLGLSVCSLFSLQDAPEVDVLSYSTDSRGVAPQEAYRRVCDAFTRLGKGADFCNKRIDSTLRGNIGAEIDGALDALGEDYRAIVVPAYPDSGRVVVNRTMLVNGMLLTDSDAGRDPKMPVTSDDVVALVKAQTKRQVAYIPLKEIARGEDSLAALVREKAASAPILVFDAVRNEDIRTVARAVRKASLKVLTVDPGPLTMQYVHVMQVSEQREQKVLLVIGSVTQTTQRQIAYILKARRVFLVQMQVAAFWEEGRRREEIRRTVEKIRAAVDQEDVLMVTTTPLDAADVVDLHAAAAQYGKTMEEISQLLSGTLTEAAAEILEKEPKLKGVYCSGGDITVALLARLKASGIEIRDEVLPLAVYGRIQGGEKPELRIVTKGGMIGGDDAIALCLNKIAKDVD